jgi:hypothetical protein
MAKLFLVAGLLFCCCNGYAQQNFIVLKKRQKSIQHFWEDSRITFQLQDGRWLSGIITRITTDSFYLTQEIIRYYPMGIDTLRVSGLAFALKSVYALPTKKEQVVYDQDNASVTLGNEKFVWIRNGFLFQVMGGGYVILNITNHLIEHDPPFSRENLLNLGIGTAVFLLGGILHRSFDPYLHIGKKYHLECVILQDTTTIHTDRKPF